jgi:hypothetical protein
MRASGLNFLQLEVHAAATFTLLGEMVVGRLTEARETDIEGSFVIRKSRALRWKSCTRYAPASGEAATGGTVGGVRERKSNAQRRQSRSVQAESEV